MPFLHLDLNNRYKDLWKAQVANHPEHFEVLEWTPQQERDLIQRIQPQLDLQAYSSTIFKKLVDLQKLILYGGICVSGEDVRPLRCVAILLNDWKFNGPPVRLAVKGYAYPVPMLSATIMASSPQDSVCKKYYDKLLTTMSEEPFENDVLIL